MTNTAIKLKCTDMISATQSKLYFNKTTLHVFQVLVCVVTMAALALASAFLIYSTFFYFVVLDGFKIASVYCKFLTSFTVAGLFIPVEFYLQFFRRRSLIQSAFLLLLVAVAFDTAISTLGFYQSDNIFFADMASSIGIERFSLLLLANEMLASALGILGGIAALVAFKPVLIKLNLIDQRSDNPSNQG